MILKEKLKKIKEIIRAENNKTLNEEKEEYPLFSKETILDDKVEEFIKWYLKKIVKSKSSNVEKYNKPRELRDFIEKMAVWYELRYPLYEVNRIINESSSKKINSEMFEINPYVTDFLEISNSLSDIKYFDWSEFYNIETFINSLTWEESLYLEVPQYKEHIYITLEKKYFHLHLSPTGIINKSEGLENYTKSKVLDKDIEGKHLKDLLTSFAKLKIILPQNNEIEKVISLYEQRVYFKEQLLNCVMYRIIERGGNRIGPRRAFLFAKEFARPIDIPMKYGIDYTDPRLKNFVFEYIKAGGNPNLECYINYFSRTTKHEVLDTITVKELIKTRYNNPTTNKSKEETELYQRMINTLINRSNQIKNNQEDSKQLKLTKY